ncbi:hypothetical protein O4O00_23475, partial [Citrobacter sedlakii]|uniref:hypothetical protein n=1 Tax=Citrobacter sedlakii TaxID=67826 RepID=UPI0022B37A9A
LPVQHMCHFFIFNPPGLSALLYFRLIRQVTHIPVQELKTRYKRRFFILPAFIPASALRQKQNQGSSPCNTG